MKFGEYSPPASPSPDQQRDALQKGLGRAVQWALSGRLDDEPLLKACVQDQRFDIQVEDSRGDWLWGIVRAVGATDRFRVPILHALYELSDDRSAQQLCELARCYAEAGDEPFRARLYEIVERTPYSVCPWLGEKEIIALDGEQGFLFAVKVRGRSLAGRDWEEWEDGRLIDDAVERFGKERVSDLLEGSVDVAIRRFRDTWRDLQRKATGNPAETHRAKVAAIPVEEVLRAAASERVGYPFPGWGRYASEADLLTVLQHLWAEREPVVVANLLKVFLFRAPPEFDARFIELCRHGDKEVRRRAFAALKRVNHPLVREFALAQLASGEHDRSVIALFIKNYRRGDEERILEVMELPDDVCQLHWLLMDVREVLEKNPEADCSRLGVIVYALTPCENCRFFAVRLLHNQQVAPGWLKEECRYDSGKECRELVGPSER
jgi:hypothetical protein